MKANIIYKVKRLPHPWDIELRKSEVYVWCLVKETKPEFGDSEEVPVAMFNLDSEAVIFQGHVFSSTNNLITIDPEIKEFFESERNHRQE